MKRAIVMLKLGLIILLCLRTPVLSGTISCNSFNCTNEAYEIVDQAKSVISLRALVIALPKKCLPGESVLFIVLFPLVLVDGSIHYDFKDRTYLDGGNFVTHSFYHSGTYLVEVDFDLTSGMKATGSTQVVIT